MQTTQIDYSCENTENSLTSYLDKELTEFEIRRIDLHLKRCSSCEQLVNEMKDMLAVARSLIDQPIDSGVQMRLRKALYQRVGHPIARVK